MKNNCSSNPKSCSFIERSNTKSSTIDFAKNLKSSLSTHCSN